MAAVEVERAGPEDWERVRALRLRALSDAPEAFATTLEQDTALAPEVWRERLVSDKAATFLGKIDGADVGLVVAAEFRGREGAAGLFAMWVAPAARGRGVGGPLVQAVVSWARSHGYARVLLEVADDNGAAIRLYERHGFVPTGATGTLPEPRTHIREHERVLEL